VTLVYIAGTKKEYVDGKINELKTIRTILETCTGTPKKLRIMNLELI